MTVNRTPFLNEEIWRLKLKDIKQKPARESVPPDLIDSPLEQRDQKMENLFRLAKNDFQIDLLINIHQGYKDWLSDGNSGTTQDYLDSLSSDQLQQLSLKEGGIVDKRNRPKEPVSVKKIDLTQELLKTADFFSRLSQSERETIDWMLRKFSGKK